MLRLIERGSLLDEERPEQGSRSLESWACEDGPGEGPGSPARRRQRAAAKKPLIAVGTSGPVNARNVGISANRYSSAVPEPS
jgi:hypothetical protein